MINQKRKENWRLPTNKEKETEDKIGKLSIENYHFSYEFFIRALNIAMEDCEKEFKRRRCVRIHDDLQISVYIIRLLDLFSYVDWGHKYKYYKYPSPHYYELIYSLLMLQNDACITKTHARCIDIVYEQLLCKKCFGSYWAESFSDKDYFTINREKYGDEFLSRLFSTNCKQNILEFEKEKRTKGFCSVCLSRKIIISYATFLRFCTELEKNNPAVKKATKKEFFKVYFSVLQYYIDKLGDGYGLIEKNICET